MARGGAPSRTNALLAVEKPLGITSHDAVARVRRAVGERRVGHAGTHDPLASGVLVVGVGQATKLLGLLTLDEKTYRARIALGAQTSTDDAEGEVVWAGPVVPELFDEGFARGRVAALAGEWDQVPPAYSAVSVGGRRAYDRARAGEDVELAPRHVVVREARLVAVEAPGAGGADGEMGAPALAGPAPARACTCTGGPAAAATPAGPVPGRACTCTGDTGPSTGECTCTDDPSFLTVGASTCDYSEETLDYSRACTCKDGPATSARECTCTDGAAAAAPIPAHDCTCTNATGSGAPGGETGAAPGPAGPVWVVDLAVSKGTYVRAIARDLGRELGCGAHLAGLVRTSAGPVGLGACLTLDELDQGGAALALERALDPVATLGLAARPLALEELADVRCGRRIALGQVTCSDGSPRAPRQGERVALVWEGGLVGVWCARGRQLVCETNFPVAIEGVRA